MKLLTAELVTESGCRYGPTSCGSLGLPTSVRVTLSAVIQIHERHLEKPSGYPLSFGVIYHPQNEIWNVLQVYEGKGSRGMQGNALNVRMCNRRVYGIR